MNLLPDISLFDSSLIDSMFEGVYFVDRERKISFWNKAAENITGYKSEEVVGKRCSDNILRHVDDKGRELCLIGCPIASSLGDGKSRGAEVFLHHKDGHRVPTQVRVAPIFGEGNEIIGAVEFFTEKRNRQRLIQEMERLKNEVFKDELTQMANRKFLLLQIRRHLQELNSLRIPLGALMIDIDHFKKINDMYGHNVGDRVLVMVSRTIVMAVREIDTAARWGGEEFFVLLPNIDPENLVKVAERIRIQIENSWIDVRGNNVLKVTASIGGVLAARGESPEEMIDRADKKMYYAKQEGRNRINV